MKRRPFHQQLTFGLAASMGLVYVGGGLFMMASSLTFGVLPESVVLRSIFGILLIAYGSYRLYRAFNQLNE